MSDVRYAVRGLRHAPLFATIAVLSMAFGIGANAAMFTLVDQVLLRQLPVERPAELVQVTALDTETLAGGIGNGTELSYAMYRDLRDTNGVFSGMFCRMPWTLQIGYAARTEQASGQLVSGSFFPELGIRPALGRLLTPEDERTVGGHPVAVLGHAYWRARFAADPTIIGKTIVVNRHPFEVVGVVEPRFPGLDFADPVQVYVPISMQPQIGPAWLKLDGRRFRFVQVFGRLKPGVGIEQAAAGLQPVYRSILEREAAAEEFTRASADAQRRFLEGRLTLLDASRGASDLRGFVSEPLVILTAAALGVLLIVCANVANLLIARGAARQREIALRLAVGGSRWQIVRLLLVESLVLAAAATMVGLMLANWGADALIGFFATPETALAVSPAPDLRILLFTGAVGIVTALLAGTLPAIRTTRLDLAPALKSAGGAVVSDRPLLRKALVVVQVALSFLLLAGAGLFVRSLDNLLRVDPGFQTERMLTFNLELESTGYDAERARIFARTIQERLSRTAGIASAAYAFQGLLGGGGWGMGFTIEGYRPPPGGRAGSMANAVSPGFFATMGMRLVDGRDFDDRDSKGFADGWPYTVAIVNETFAKRYFAGANPIGRRVGFGTNPDTAMRVEIVGLVRDAKYTAIREENRPQIFFPYLQARIEGLRVYVRTNQDPMAVMPAIRREIASLDADIAVAGIATIEDLVGRSVVNERLVASLSAVLGGMATLLSVVGLYGVMAYVVSRRTREIGIRMALGAVGADIAGSVLREAAALIAAGLLIGGGVSWWLGRYLEGQLYGITPGDAPTFAAAALLLAAVGAVASMLPAARAAKIAPMNAIRGE